VSKKYSQDGWLQRIAHIVCLDNSANAQAQNRSQFLSKALANLVFGPERRFLSVKTECEISVAFLNLNRNILGFCIVTLGFFIPSGFYPLDFGYRFGKKRHPKSRDEKNEIREAQAVQETMRPKTVQSSN